MNAVPAVERRVDDVGVPRVLHHLVEINDRIERRAGANPLIHLVADPRLRRVPPVLFSAGGQLCRGSSWRRRFSALNLTGGRPLRSGDHLRGGCLPADIVGAHEQDDVVTRDGQHVAIEPVRAGGLSGGCRRARWYCRRCLRGGGHCAPVRHDRRIRPAGLRAGPPPVMGVRGRAGAVGDRVAERHDRSGGGRRHTSIAFKQNVDGGSGEGRRSFGPRSRHHCVGTTSPARQHVAGRAFLARINRLTAEPPADPARASAPRRWSRCPRRHRGAVDRLIYTGGWSLTRARRLESAARHGGPITRGPERVVDPDAPRREWSRARSSARLPVSRGRAECLLRSGRRSIVSMTGTAGLLRPRPASRAAAATSEPDARIGCRHRVVTAIASPRNPTRGSKRCHRI